MIQVGIRELRDRVSALVKRASGGEIIEVTSHGHVVAHLVPPPQKSIIEQMIADGRATPAQGDLLRHKGLPPVPGRPTMSEALAQLRADER